MSTSQSWDHPPLDPATLTGESTATPPSVGPAKAADRLWKDSVLPAKPGAPGNAGGPPSPATSSGSPSGSPPAAAISKPDHEPTWELTSTGSWDGPPPGLMPTEDETAPPTATSSGTAAGSPAASGAPPAAKPTGRAGGLWKDSVVPTTTSPTGAAGKSGGATSPGSSPSSGSSAPPGAARPGGSAANVPPAEPNWQLRESKSWDAPAAQADDEAAQALWRESTTMPSPFVEPPSKTASDDSSDHEAAANLWRESTTMSGPHPDLVAPSDAAGSPTAAAGSPPKPPAANAEPTWEMTASMSLDQPPPGLGDPSPASPPSGAKSTSEKLWKDSVPPTVKSEAPPAAPGSGSSVPPLLDSAAWHSGEPKGPRVAPQPVPSSDAAAKLWKDSVPPETKSPTTGGSARAGSTGSGVHSTTAGTTSTGPTTEKLWKDSVPPVAPSASPPPMPAAKAPGDSAVNLWQDTMTVREPVSIPEDEGGSDVIPGAGGNADQAAGLWTDTQTRAVPPAELLGEDTGGSHVISGLWAPPAAAKPKAAPSPAAPSAKAPAPAAAPPTAKPGPTAKPSPATKAAPPSVPVSPATGGKGFAAPPGKAGPPGKAAASKDQVMSGLYGDDMTAPELEMVEPEPMEPASDEPSSFGGDVLTDVLTVAEDDTSSMNLDAEGHVLAAGAAPPVRKQPKGPDPSAPPMEFDIGAAPRIGPVVPNRPSKPPEVKPRKDPERDEMMSRISGLWRQSILPDMKPDETIGRDQGIVAARSVAKSAVKPRTVCFHNARKPGQALPDYELHEILGEGGMGIVYLSRQTSVDRMLAVKMLKPKYARDADIQERFLAEATATADLDHPNIVPIHDLGRGENGEIFYSMKRVQGTPWSDEYLAKTMSENLEILLRVCDAVSYAHSRNIIHRDLKPDNVMLGEYGEVLVMDWGLSASIGGKGKAFQAAVVESRVGTPAYMPPETAEGRPEHLRVTSDVYLLGATLYELLTGRPPHRGDSVMDCLMAAGQNDIQPTDKSGELMDIAMKAMATNPDDRYQTVAEFRQVIRDYESHQESFLLSAKGEQYLAAAQKSGDYDDYAQAMFAYREALELWPGNESAGQELPIVKLAYARTAFEKADLDLAASLLTSDDPDQAALRGQIQHARNDRLARQARLQLMTRASIAMAAGIILILGFGLVWINNERAIAKNAAIEAQEQRKAADLARDQAVAARTELQKQQQDLIDARNLAEKRKQDAEQETIRADKERKKAVEEEQKAIAQKKIAEDALADAEAARSAEKAQFKKTQDALQKAVYEEYMATIGLFATKIEQNGFRQGDQTLAELLDAKSTTSEALRNWEWGRLAFLCDLSARNLTADNQAVLCVAASRDGKSILTGGSDGRVRLWSATSSEDPIAYEFGRPIWSVAFTPDGRRLAMGDNEGNVSIWDRQARGNAPRLWTEAIHAGPVHSLEFTSDGSRLITAGGDGQARIVDAASGKTIRPITGGHSGAVWSAKLSPRGTHLATCGEDGRMVIWDLRSEAELRKLNLRGDELYPRPLVQKHPAGVYDVEYSPDGKYIASACGDKLVRIWPVTTEPRSQTEKLGEMVVLSLHDAAVRSLDFSIDGARLLSAGDDHTVCVWGLPQGQLQKRLRGHGGPITEVAFVDGTRTVASSSYDGMTKLWLIDRYAEQYELDGHRGQPVMSARYAPSGRELITAGGDGMARLWTIDPRDRRWIPGRAFDQGHTQLVNMAAVSADGKYGITCSGGDQGGDVSDNSVRVWDLSTGAEVQRFGNFNGPAHMAVFSPAGKEVLTIADDRRQRVCLWDVATGKLVSVIAIPDDDVRAAAFLPGGKQVITATRSTKLEIWDVSKPNAPRVREVAISHGPGLINAIAVLPDASAVVTASDDRAAVLWDLTSGKQLLSMPHNGRATCAAVSADGKTIVTGGDDNRAKVWRVADRTQTATLEHAAPVVSIAFSPDDSQILTASHLSRLRIWDRATGKQQSEVAGSDRTAYAAYLPDGQRALTASGKSGSLVQLKDGRELLRLGRQDGLVNAFFYQDQEIITFCRGDRLIRIWTKESGRMRLAYRVEAHQVALDPAAAVVAAGGVDGKIRLYEAASGKLLGELPGHKSQVTSLAFSHDGKRLVTASVDRTAKVWDLEKKALIASLDGHSGSVVDAQFSPTMDRVVTASHDGTAIVWEPQGGKWAPLGARLRGHSGLVTGACFSPDGHRVVTTSDDQTAKLWDPGGSREILTLKGHRGAITGVEFSPKFDAILTAGLDGLAIVWPAESWQPAQMAQVNTP